MYKTVPRSYLSLALLLLITSTSFAKIPEPPNIFYGTATVDGVRLTKDNTNTTVTMKQGETVLASYTMGENPAVGSQYVLRVPLSALDPPAPGTARSGDTTQIYIADRLATTVTIGPRGRVMLLPLAVGTQSPPSIPGDADGDGVVNVLSVHQGDIAALIAEIFDGDGNVVGNINGGTFVGHPGSDANADIIVDAADIACAVLRSAQGTCASGPGGPEEAVLSIAQAIPARPDSLVTVPVRLRTNGAHISSLTFSLDYDATLLDFDPTDSDGDGIPDAMTLHVPDTWQVRVDFDASDTHGEIDIAIVDLTLPLESLPDGLVIAVTLRTAVVSSVVEAAVGFSQSPAASLGSTAGQSVPSVTTDGSVLIGMLLQAGNGPHDLDSDGKGDIVWRHSQTGTVAVWLMDGVRLRADTVMLEGIDLAWQIVGVGDVDGDGKADLLWRHMTLGDVGVWLLDGATLTSAAVVYAGVGLDWQIVGVGDVDGDGKADLLWRHMTLGDVGVWLLDGATLTHAAMVYAGVGLDWQIVGMGDVDGDGRADLLWRHMTLGDVGVWLLDGATLTHAAMLYTAVDLDWQIVGVGDVDADGKGDIVWRHRQTGTVAMWLMDGVQLRAGTVVLEGVDLDWEVQ